VRKLQTRFEYMVRHRESFKFLAYTRSMNKLSLVTRVDAWSGIVMYELPQTRKWLATTPERQFPGKTKREDYEIVRIMTEVFERKTVQLLEKKTKKKKGKK
jgi:hypothetical protein